MELADGVDVRGVEGVADDCQPLRGVQGDALGASVDPLQVEDFSGGGDSGDELEIDLGMGSEGPIAGSCIIE